MADITGVKLLHHSFCASEITCVEKDVVALGIFVRSASSVESQSRSTNQSAPGHPGHRSCQVTFPYLPCSWWFSLLAARFQGSKALTKGMC